MNFGDVISMVVDETKRGDKLSDIRRGINAAIEFFASANFMQDHVEEDDFAIDGNLYAQSFDVTASPFSRFKVINYIRPTGYKNVLGWRDPKKVFQNGCEALDVYYRSGNNIIFKLSKLQTELKIGWFQYHAVLDDDADEDWMLDELTSAIVLYSRSRIMRSIGEDAEANNNFKEAMLLWEAAKQAKNEMQG